MKVQAELGHVYAIGSMPASRLSQSAEAARAAAQQAEFNEKKWVWIPDEKEGYLAGWVHSEDDEMGQVVLASGGEVFNLERNIQIYDRFRFAESHFIH